jgi:hypothetical protein
MMMGLSKPACEMHLLGGTTKYAGYTSAIRQKARATAIAGKGINGVGKMLGKAGGTVGRSVWWLLTKPLRAVWNGLTAGGNAAVSAATSETGKAVGNGLLDVLLNLFCSVLWYLTLPLQVLFNFLASLFGVIVLLGVLLFVPATRPILWKMLKETCWWAYKLYWPTVKLVKKLVTGKDS